MGLRTTVFVREFRENATALKGRTEERGDKAIVDGLVRLAETIDRRLTDIEKKIEARLIAIEKKVDGPCLLEPDSELLKQLNDISAFMDEARKLAKK